MTDDVEYCAVPAEEEITIDTLRAWAKELTVSIAAGKKTLTRTLHRLFWLETGIRAGTIVEWEGAEYRISQVDFAFGYYTDRKGNLKADLKGCKRNKNGEFSGKAVNIYASYGSTITVLDKTK